MAEVGVRVPRHDLPPHQAHRQGDGLRDGGLQVLRVRPQGGCHQGGGGLYELELQTKVSEDYTKFYNHGEGPLQDTMLTNLLVLYDPSASQFHI